ncbi:MAG: hypothetical protein LM523_13180 [Candidatus Contendobacter sp.]|nr:hypothetical protein [Candidatus Contendobacter sp.]
MLLLAVGVVADVGQQVGRSRDFRAFRLDAAAGELDGRKDQGRLGVTAARKLGKVFGFHVQPFLVNQPRQLGGQRHHVHAGRALTHQHGQ